jgi:hypothetical protein
MLADEIELEGVVKVISPEKWYINTPKSECVE